MSRGPMLVLLVAAGILAGAASARADTPHPPLHAFGPPTVEQWAHEFGGPNALAFVLSRDLYEHLLDAYEDLPLCDSEREACLRLREQDSSVEAELRRQIETLRAERDALQAGRTESLAAATEMRDRSRRRGRAMLIGIGVGFVGGVLVSR